MRAVKTVFICLFLIGMVLLNSGCAGTQSTENTKKGAVAGGLVGAAAGAIIGHQTGRGLEGAAIGAAAGGTGGALLGSAKDEEEDRNRYEQDRDSYQQQPNYQSPPKSTY